MIRVLFNDVKTFMIHHTPLGVSTSISISGNKKINLDRKRGTMPLSQKKSFPNYVKLTPHGEGGALIAHSHPQPPLHVEIASRIFLLNLLVFHSPIALYVLHTYGC